MTTLDLSSLLSGDNGVFSLDYVVKPVQQVTYNSGGLSVLDHGQYNIFNLVADGASTTISHSNVPSGKYTFVLYLDWTAGFVSFPSTWLEGDAPPTGRGRYLITGTSVDGGNRWSIKVENYGFDFTLEEYFNAVQVADGVPLETELQEIVRAFVNGLKTDGIWDKIDMLGIFGLARTLNGALIPIKGPTPTNINFVSADYTRNLGLKGNGVDKRLDLNYLNTATPQEEQHLSVYVSNAYDWNDYLIGCGAIGQTGASSIFLNTVGTISANVRNGTAQVGGSTTLSRNFFAGIARETTSGGSTRLHTAQSYFAQGVENTRTGDIFLFGTEGNAAYSDSTIFFYSVGSYTHLEKLRARVDTLNTQVRAFFGEAVFDVPGTYTWTAPAGVTSVSAVCIGGGGGGRTSTSSIVAVSGGGGGLGWKSNIAVTPGQSYTVVVGAGGAAGGGGNGGQSYFIDPTTVAGNGGNGGLIGPPLPATVSGGSFVGDGGGNGGNSVATGNFALVGGAGGAGGYSGAGGSGNNVVNTLGGSGSGGGGGAGGVGSTVSGSPGGCAGAGGGVGLYGQGSNGNGGGGVTGASSGWGGRGGFGGSGGRNGYLASTSLSSGGLYSATSLPMAGNYGGGGSTGGSSTAGGTGAVRILWGAGRAFPSTDVDPCPTNLL